MSNRNKLKSSFCDDVFYDIHGNTKYTTVGDKFDFKPVPEEYKGHTFLNDNPDSWSYDKEKEWNGFWF